MAKCEYGCGQDDVTITGYIDPDIYDGVLFWICNACNFAWARDWSAIPLRMQAAEAGARNWNENERRRSKLGDNLFPTLEEEK